MISTFSFVQLVTIYSIIVLTSESFNCHEFCEKPDLLSEGKVIFETATYKYSLFYHYSQFIRLDQSPPKISGNFVKLVDDEKIDLNFPFTFYGADLSTFNIDDDGTIFLNGEGDSRQIFNYIRDVVCEVEILNGKESFAVKVSCPTNIDNKDDTFKAMHLIHSNGKISFYYENIPRGLEDYNVISGIGYYIWCENQVIVGYQRLSVKVPFEWIRSGTLVEYEVLGDCPNHSSPEACHGATTLNKTCIWCKSANICTTSNDEHVDVFEVNGCQKKSSVVKVYPEPTTPATTENDLGNELKETNPTTESHMNMSTDTTTLATTETDLGNELKKTNPTTESHMNMTTDTTEDTEETKILQYVYIVVPLVISFLIVCAGCGIWVWFHRRKRVYP